MVEKLLLEIYLPATEKSYSVRLPAGLNVHAAAVLAGMALSEASEGLFMPSRNCMLFWKDTGRGLNARKTLWESGVQNGSRLILI